MKPSWEELKKNHPKDVELADVESEEVNEYQYSRNENRIQDFPTLRLYYKDKLIKNMMVKGILNQSIDFLMIFKKNKNISKNNMVIMKSKKGNQINSKLIKKVIQNKKKKI